MHFNLHQLIMALGALVSVVLFLNVCPLTLPRIHSNYIHTAVDGYYFQYHRLTHVRHRHNWFRPSIRGIIDGSFFGVESTAPWRVAFSSNKPGVAPAPVTHPKKRPTIVTIHSGQEDDSIVAAWRRAWYAAGFDPQIISGTSTSLKDKMKAAVEAEALIYCDKHIIPIDFRPNLPGGRMKEELSESREKSGYKGDHPRWRPSKYLDDLYHTNDVINKLKGTPTTTNLFSEIEDSIHLGLIHFQGDAFLRDALKKLNSPQRSSVEIGREFTILPDNTRALGVYTPDNMETITGYAHLEDETVADMISAHKRNMFASVFSNGLQIIDPYDTMSDVFSLPSLRLAQRLGACPNVLLAKTCPPTAQILKYYKEHKFVLKSRNDNELVEPALTDHHAEELQKLGCNICHEQSRIRLLRSYNLRPNTFKIGTLVHPLTRVAAEHRSKDINIEMVYDSSTAYESWVHNVTSRVISSDRFGSVPRVLMMKDIMYKSFFEQSNSLWMAWEDEFAPGADSDDEVEFHLGFVLPPEPASKAEVKSFKSFKADHGASLDFLEKGDTIMESINRRLFSDDGTDTILNTVESWNIPDTEIWRFLQELKYLQQDDLIR